MRTITFIISLVVLHLTTSSQTVLDTNNILPKKIVSVDYINFGASFPISSFSKRIKSTENSGFATVGIKLDAAINYQFYKNLGIKAMFIYQNNQIDDYKYKKDLYAEAPLNSYTISSKGWNNFSALFGAYANFKLDDNMYFQPKILLGFNYGTSPVIDLTVSDTSKKTFLIEQQRGQALSFCYVLGFDFKLELVKNYYMLFGFDSYNADMYFDGVNVKNINDGTESKFKFKQPIQTLSFKVGVGRTFN